MAKNTRRLTVAIPTYRRPHLLERVLGELERQSRTPERLIVVDGEGGAAPVLEALEQSGWGARTETLLLPSTHANLPFQRWLARRAVGDSDDLIFFDDDVLLPDRDTLAKLCAALESASAATCAVNLPLRANARKPLWAKFAAALRPAPDGRLTPGGVRRRAAADGSALPTVEWLRGPVMAFRCADLPAERFPHNLFGLAQIGAGMGEELALARRVVGRIAFVRGLTVEHPDTEPSQVLSPRQERQGFAVAYSRRLLNDLCRGGRPTVGDRIGLAWTWCGGLASACGACLSIGSKGRPAFARGYLRGVIHGVLRPPTHERLTPGIDWEKEATQSLAAAVRIASPTEQREAACRTASA